MFSEAFNLNLKVKVLHILRKWCCILTIGFICQQDETIKSGDLRHFFCSVHKLLLIKILSRVSSSAFTSKALADLAGVYKELE